MSLEVIELFNSLVTDTLKEHSACFQGIKTPEELCENFIFRKILKDKVAHASAQIYNSSISSRAALDDLNGYTWHTGRTDEVKKAKYERDIREADSIIRSLERMLNDEFAIIVALRN